MSEHEINQCTCSCHKKPPVLLYGSGKWKCGHCKCEGLSFVDPGSGFGKDASSFIGQANEALGNMMGIRQMPERDRDSFINDWCLARVEEMGRAHEQAAIDFLASKGLTKEEAVGQVVIYHGLDGFQSMEFGLVRDELNVKCACGHTVGLHPTKHNKDQIKEFEKFGCLKCQSKEKYLGSDENKEHIHNIVQSIYNHIQSARSSNSLEEKRSLIDYYLEKTLHDLSDLKDEINGICTEPKVNGEI